MTWKLARKNHLAIVMYKVINDKAPGYLINLFEKKIGKSGYALRESESRHDLLKYNTILNLLKAVVFLLSG